MAKFQAADQDLRFLEGLNAEQQIATAHVDGPMLVLAGAGSGKTRVITHRIARLICVHGVNASSILALTFTNKAASEMKQRIETLLETPVAKLWIGTFHSMMARILRRFPEKIGYRKNFTILDTSAQETLMKQIFREMGMQDSGAFRPGDILQKISSMKSSLSSLKDFRHKGELLNEATLTELYTRYEDLKRQNNTMDFDDLLTKTVDLFEQNPDILNLYQQHFSYILVDEYQDTNPAQFRLIELLAQPKQNVFVVGDDDQSIYAFRGADMRIILSFEQQFPKAKVVKLEQNYRSTKRILDAANAVISRNKKRKAKALWTSGMEGDLIRYVLNDDQIQEGKVVADRIRQAMDEGVDPSQIAVLYRQNALTRHMEKVLKRAEIPYRILSGLSFFDRREIKDLMAYLNLILYPSDDLSFFRIVNVPRRGIGAKTLEQIRDLGRMYQKSALEICYRSPQIESLASRSKPLYRFACLILTLRRSLLEGGLTLQDFVELVQRESGLEQAILDEQMKERARGEDPSNRIENLRELLSDIVEFSRTVDLAVEEDLSSEELERAGFAEEAKRVAEKLEARRMAQNENKEAGEKYASPELLGAYLEHVALSTSQDQSSDAEAAVNLLTVHSAKGLEFDLVCLIGFDEGLFPTYRSIGDQEALEEERRLAYVALTRARKWLLITSAKSRLLFGKTDRYMPSRFAGELPDECLDYVDQSLFSYGEQERDYSGMHSKGLSRREESSYRGGDSRADWTLSSRASTATRRELPGLKQVKARLTQRPNPFGVKSETALKPQDMKTGLRVRHQRFGVGRVMSYQAVAHDMIVEISFEERGVKRLMLSSAQLEAEK